MRFGTRLGSTSRFPGGGGGGACAPTVSESMFASPPAVVAEMRTVLVPAVSMADTVCACQMSQLPVGPNDGVEWATPLMVSAAGRVDVAPLAYRKASVWGPPVVALTLNSTAASTALALLTKPLPVNPGWVVSTT